MLSAIFKHVYLILTLQHTGDGLKTGKSFTFFLIFLIIALSIVGELEKKFSTILLESIGMFVILLMLYFTSKKEIVNGLFLAFLLFFCLTGFFPSLIWPLVFWIIVANASLQIRHNRKIK